MRSSTGALGAVFDDGDVRKSLDDLERGIRLPKDTRGAVVAIGGRLVAAFRRMWPRRTGTKWRSRWPASLLAKALVVAGA